MSEPYQHDHVTYDEFETPATLHCLRCPTVIARRHSVPTKEKGVAVHAISKAPNYREVYAELSDGSICYLTFCQDCIKQPVDGDAAFEAVKRGWEKALTRHGRPVEAIELQRAKVAGLHVTKVGGNN